jgi:hypothetical protein
MGSGRRPRVRGMAMNPVDHPNGGGQGKSKGGGGRQQLVSPWGSTRKRFSHEAPLQNHEQPDSGSPQWSSAAQQEVIITRYHGSLHQKRFLRRLPPARENREGNQVRCNEEAHSDLVSPLDDHPGFYRAHLQRSQWQSLCCRVRDRKHGGS